MSVNPWLVENIQTFSFLNCPECAFKTKTEDMFKNHAVGNHPLSCILFDKSTKTIVKEEAMSESESEQITEESDKTLEELMYSEFGSPEPLNHVQAILVKQNHYSFDTEKIKRTKCIKEEKTLEEIIYPENDSVDVKCADNHIKIKDKPTSVSESLKGNHNADTTTLDNTEFILDGISSSDPLFNKILHCPDPNCDFETSRRNNLDFHIKSHNNCEYCGESFAGKRQLAKHLTKCQAKPPKPKKQHFCGFCNREFNQSSNKQKHMKICKKIPKSFVCEFCNNDFSYLSRKDLNVHRQMCETSFNMMVEPDMYTQSMVIKEEIDQ